MATYTHTTLLDARQQLAVRLGDPTNIFWTDAELGVYLVDALRHWNLLAQYSKDKANFSTTAAQPFYSLATQLPALRSYTVTDQDLILALEYHLMENPTPGFWSGTEQFTFDVILDSITRVRDQLLLETGAVLQVDNLPSGPPPVYRVSLPDTIIDVRRVAWKTPDSYKTLRQRDSISRRSFSPTASFNPGVPNSYLKANQPYVNIELSPPANDVGTLQIISTRSGATVTGAGALLGIPNDFLPTLKWGVLSDLLNTERASDSDRAAYCEARWQEGLANCKTSPVIWAMDVNGQQVSTSSLTELDAFNANWQNSSAHPTQVASAGFDLLVLSPVPDAIYAVTAEVTRTFPSPVNDGDFLQIGREYKDVLLDYCVHLATFKQGGDTFLGSKPQFESFMAAAQKNNSRLRAQAFYLDSATEQSTREEHFRLREVGA